MPEEYAAVSIQSLGTKKIYPELAYEILSKFVDDIPSDDLRRMVNETYTKEMFGNEIVPVKKLEDGLYLLRLSEGPTLAFKDIALQLLHSMQIPKPGGAGGDAHEISEGL